MFLLLIEHLIIDSRKMEKQENLNGEARERLLAKIMIVLSNCTNLYI